MHLHAFTHSFSDSLLQLHDLKVNSELQGSLEGWEISSPRRWGQGKEWVGHIIHGAGNWLFFFFLGFYPVSSASRWGASFESLSETIRPREYWWGVLGIWGRSAAHLALQKGSAAVVWVGSLVMLHLWLICGLCLKYTHRQEFLFHWASSWSELST